MTSPCRGPNCQADIDWVTKADGTGALPVTHPGPCGGSGLSCTHEGTLAVHRERGRLIYRPVPAGGLLAPLEHWGMPHHAECPDAGQFRRQSRRGPGKCSRCHHKAHPGAECAHLGRVTCRTVTTPQGTASVRGRFPCGCQPEEAAGAQS